MTEWYEGFFEKAMACGLPETHLWEAGGHDVFSPDPRLLHTGRYFPFSFTYDFACVRLLNRLQTVAPQGLDNSNYSSEPAFVFIPNESHSGTVAAASMRTVLNGSEWLMSVS